VSFTAGIKDVFCTAPAATFTPRVRILKQDSAASLVGNTGTGVTDLKSFTLPANALSPATPSLRITVSGAFAGNTNGKGISFVFGGTGQALNPVTTAPNGVAWRAVMEIVRVTSTSQYLAGESTIGTVLQSTFAIAPAENEAGPIVVKVIAQGGATNDVLQRGFVIEQGEAAS